jgi:hypothetical protein
MFRTSIQVHSEAGHSDKRKALRIIVLDEDMIHWTLDGLRGEFLLIIIIIIIIIIFINCKWVDTRWQWLL